MKRVSPERSARKDASTALPTLLLTSAGWSLSTTSRYGPVVFVCCTSKTWGSNHHGSFEEERALRLNSNRAMRHCIP
ncbi:unnamed protein product [Calypogeia fissa]